MCPFFPYFITEKTIKASIKRVKDLNNTPFVKFKTGFAYYYLANENLT